MNLNIMNNIRNFSIVAHIDHGKSTLADRIIEICGGLSTREMSDQVLDSMDIERERGITIKAQTVALTYKSENGFKYNLNIIDTPGHVDFVYEVNRSLLACEGVLLLIDITQGIEAQTISNYFMAINLGLKIIPVLNKVDLLNYCKKDVLDDIEKNIGIKSDSIICCSAKTGYGIKKLIENIILKIPSPSGNIKNPLQALIIDSWFNNYVGVVLLVRVFNGVLKIKDKIKFMHSGYKCNVENLGIFTPKSRTCKFLSSGNVGFIISGIRKFDVVFVGDTITTVSNSANFTLPGFKKINPQVFSGLYPINTSDYSLLRSSLDKLKLNDSSLVYERESSLSLGFGFRCGFLGLLHKEIVKERLEREFGLKLIITLPTVVYEIVDNNNNIIRVDNPSKIKNLSRAKEIREPVMEMNLYTPKEYLGSIIKLCSKRRGIQVDLKFNLNYVYMVYDIPMCEIILDFFDKLKSISKGYASMNYKFKKFCLSNIVKVDILINKVKIDVLSFMIHYSHVNFICRNVVLKMCKIIPRQMYDVKVQAAIGKKIIISNNIKAKRKDVISKCYGGDITRKKKLLEKQKIGKKRMKKIGYVNIPNELFSFILSEI